MKETLKKNWKGITATVVAFGAVFGAIYYVNCVYLPGQRQAQSTEPAVTEPMSKKEYHYTVDTSNAQAADANSGTTNGSSTNPANDRINVTTDADGNVTVDRTWDAAPGELDTSTEAPSGPTANMGSGGGKITGEDGAYHGEQPSTGNSGTTTTKPSTGTENKPTTPPADKPTTPSGGGSTTEKPSGGSGTGGSTPENGDTRTENGQNQIYIDGFGWVMDASGGESDYIEMPDELSGIQVGEMG